MLLLASKEFPNAIFSQYTSSYDFDSAFRLLNMRSEQKKVQEPVFAEKSRWFAKLREEYFEKHQDLMLQKNYFQFIGPGDSHCVTVYDRFFWLGVHDWLVNVSEGAAQNVDCAVGVSPSASSGRWDASGCLIGVATEP